MGWGTGEHEGYADQKWPDGRWSGATHRGGDPDAVAYQAICICGWRSEREHPVAPRPANGPRDERGRSHGPAWEAWNDELEKTQDACWEDWNAEHFEALLGYEPHQQLILAEDDGGRRHFLDGHPIHAGTCLELLGAAGHWLTIRYEWSWDEQPPTAQLTLGAPPGAERHQIAPAVSFPLPPRAVLRWPQRNAAHLAA